MEIEVIKYIDFVGELKKKISFGIKSQCKCDASQDYNKLLEGSYMLYDDHVQNLLILDEIKDKFNEMEQEYNILKLEFKNLKDQNFTLNDEKKKLKNLVLQCEGIITKQQEIIQNNTNPDQTGKKLDETEKKNKEINAHLEIVKKDILKNVKPDESTNLKNIDDEVKKEDIKNENRVSTENLQKTDISVETELHQPLTEPKSSTQSDIKDGEVKMQISSKKPIEVDKILNNTNEKVKKGYTRERMNRMVKTMKKIKSKGELEKEISNVEPHTSDDLTLNGFLEKSFRETKALTLRKKK